MSLPEPPTALFYSEGAPHPHQSAAVERWGQRWSDEGLELSQWALHWSSAHSVNLSYRVGGARFWLAGSTQPRSMQFVHLTEVCPRCRIPFVYSPAVEGFVCACGETPGAGRSPFQALLGTVGQLDRPALIHQDFVENNAQGTLEKGGMEFLYATLQVALLEWATVEAAQLFMGLQLVGEGAPR